MVHALSSQEEQGRTTHRVFWKRSIRCSTEMAEMN